MADRTAARYLPVFRHDLRNVLAWSEDHFGTAAAERYAVLVRQALRDVLEDAERPGASLRPDLGRHAYVYHLMFSRDRVPGERVKTPRHFVLYRYSARRLEFARLLHDSFDLERHLTSGYLR